jgi:hypothetical protein
MLTKEIKGAITNGVETASKSVLATTIRPYGSYSITVEAYASCQDCGDDWPVVEKSEDCYDLSKMGESTQAAIDACMEELTPKIEAHSHA